MNPALGRGNETQVFTEQDFITLTPQTDVTYRPLGSREVQPEAPGDGWGVDADGALVAVRDGLPWRTITVTLDKPLRLEDQAADYHGLTDEDPDGVREFWLVHAGHELHVWCLRLNELSDRRAAREAEQQGEDNSFHRLGDYLSTLNLELDALKKIEFFFTQLVNAAGEVHRQNFLDQLGALIDRQEWKQHLRDRLGNA